MKTFKLNAETAKTENLTEVQKTELEQTINAIIEQFNFKLSDVEKMTFGQLNDMANRFKDILTAKVDIQKTNEGKRSKVLDTFVDMLLNEFKPNKEGLIVVSVKEACNIIRMANLDNYLVVADVNTKKELLNALNSDNTETLKSFLQKAYLFNTITSKVKATSENEVENLFNAVVKWQKRAIAYLKSHIALTQTNSNGVKILNEYQDKLTFVKADAKGLKFAVKK